MPLRHGRKRLAPHLKTTMNSQIKQIILDAAVEKINELVLEEFMEGIHDAVTDSMVETLGDVVDFSKEETFDIMMELCGRIAIVALPE